MQKTVMGLHEGRSLKGNVVNVMNPAVDAI